MGSWRAFLVNLKSRGLLGKNLELITLDGKPGLPRATREIYPFLGVQRCLVHKLERLYLKPCMSKLGRIFNAPTPPIISAEKLT